MAIGSVGVNVVPDARDFWRRFVAATSPGAAKAGADLGRDVRRGMQEELARGATINVKADTGAARAEIASVGDAANTSSRSLAPLIAGIGLVATAAIPIGAVAVPALATLALGAKEAKTQFAALTPELHQLQDVAGKALAPGVSDLVTSLEQAEPQLRKLFSLFGTAISDELKHFDNALNNGGLQTFVRYAEKELPVVEGAFNSILGAVVDLGKVLAPVGDVILKDIGQVGHLISNVANLVGQVEQINKQITSIHVPGTPDGTLGKVETVAKGNLPAGLNLINSGLSKFGGVLSALAPHEGRFISDSEEAAQALRSERAAVDQARAALQKYDATVAKSIGNKVSEARAENLFIDAVRGVADAAKQGGSSLSILSAAGQANREAITQAAQAALDFYNAQIQAGVGSKQAAIQLAGDVKSLELTATHAGLAKGGVDKLLASMGLLPSKITTVFAVDITPALNAIQAVNNLLSAIPGLGIASIPTAVAAALAKAAEAANTGGKVARGSVIPGNGIPGTLGPTPSTPKTPTAATPDAVFTKLVQELQAVRQARLQEIATIKSAVTGTFDITTAGQNQYGEPVTLFDIQGQLKLALQNAKRFEQVMKKLAREGLNDSLLQQLAEAGPAALPQAQALLSATPKQLAQINREYRQLSKAGGQLGTFVGNDFYKAGIQAADGLVKGLRSKDSELSKAMKHMARVMIQSLRRELNMHSPSKRLFDEGALAFEGYRLGIESKAASIEQAVAGLASKSIPNRSAYKFGHLNALEHVRDVTVYQNFPMAVSEPPSRSQLAAARGMRNALTRR